MEVSIVKVIINNKEEHIPENITVLELFKYKKIRSNSSIWINDRQLLLKEYNSYQIKENDDLKIITIIGGG